MGATGVRQSPQHAVRFRQRQLLGDGEPQRTETAAEADLAGVHESPFGDRTGLRPATGSTRAVTSCSGYVGKPLLAIGRPEMPTRPSCRHQGRVDQT
ncbi:MAG: hypothetical protein AVDCRST_MAG34-2742 [uncultured Nocardioidaceae bacterium]|uniref:Uncharacterized protein n=1 Tax=uncultured Nocardioidaceae bacterium TaxID=253824 RepID=A0A6J4MQ91_9ACTN|nr:MAG: hypothetical protein AVDCRST_MAG34-2742 [uncultured Nocardioidaceae bacterium]